MVLDLRLNNEHDVVSEYQSNVQLPPVARESTQPRDISLQTAAPR